MSYLSDEQANNLIKALFSMIYELHPTYSSTAGRHGGYGGAALTPSCSYIRPETEQEIMASTEWCYEALAEAMRAAERAGVDLKTLSGYGIPHPERRRRR